MARGGKRVGAGRKPKADEIGIAVLLDKAFPQSEREAVVVNLIRIAKGDDLKAAVSASSLLLNYTFGKPTEKHEHSGNEGEAIQIVVNHVNRPSAS